MKGENSITSYCIQIRENMMAKQRNISFLKHWIYIHVMNDDSKREVGDLQWTMDGYLILNKLGRRRVKLCQKAMASLQC